MVGVKTQLEDANLQQFINSKTQGPVTFSYRKATHDQLPIGVIHIPVQARPLYAKADFGVVKKDVVYIRRSSSTDIAKPDEIARMGDVDVALAQQPSLELDVIDRGTRQTLGTRLTVKEPTWLEVPPTETIPDYHPSSSSPFLYVSYNRDFLRDIAAYMRAIRLYPITLALRNTAGTAAHEVRVVFEVPDDDFRYDFIAGSDMPREPRRRHDPIANLRSPKSVFAQRLGVEVHREGHKEAWINTMRFSAKKVRSRNGRLADTRSDVRKRRTSAPSESRRRRPSRRRFGSRPRHGHRST